MSYLSASELASLVDCKPNQKCKMIAWLTKNRWRFEVSANGLPKVAQAYHDRKMGITEEKVQAKYADAPDFSSFAR